MRKESNAFCGLVSHFFHGKVGAGLALIVEDQWANGLRALDHAGATHVMPVTVTSLDEGVSAVGAFVRLFLSMRLLMVYHVAELGCLNVTLQAAEKLISATCSLVHHVVLLEAHVAGVGAVSVSHSLLDGLLEGWHTSILFDHRLRTWFLLFINLLSFPH